MASVVLPLCVLPACWLTIDARQRRWHDAVENAVTHVVVETVDQCRGLANAERRREHHRRKQSAHAAAVERELPLEHRTFRRNDVAERRGDGAKQVLGLCGGDLRPGIAHANAEFVDPQASVGIEHYFDHARVGQRIEHSRTELTTQLLLQTHVQLIVQR